MTDTYRFGPFELDARAAELRREGAVVPLQPQPAGVLTLLVRRAGELVTREEIQAAIWPDRVVDYEQGLNYAIRQIRSALGDDAETPRYVETLPRRGYRFAAPVERLPDAEAIREGRSRRVVAYGLAGLLLAAGTFAAWAGFDREAPAAVEETPLPADPAAREAFLIARGLLQTRDRLVLERAQRGFEETLTFQPDYAPAWVGVGEALLRSGRPAEARAPLERALQLDAGDPQAHHLIAQVLLFHAWEWEAASRHLEEALRIRPGQASTYQVQAYWHALNGRVEEARTSMGRALRLDPLSAYVQADAGWIDYWAGRLETADTLCSRTLELDPESRSARTCLLFVRIERGDTAGVREAAGAILVSHHATEAELAGLRDSPAPLVPDRYWWWEVRRLEASPDRSPDDAFLLALAYAQLGRSDDAFRELETAWRGRSTWMLWLEVEPRLEALRGDSRWPGLVGRMGFPRSTAG